MMTSVSGAHENRIARDVDERALPTPSSNIAREKFAVLCAAVCFISICAGFGPLLAGNYPEYFQAAWMIAMAGDAGALIFGILGAIAARTDGARGIFLFCCFAGPGLFFLMICLSASH
jgi:hypothetical protein